MSALSFQVDANNETRTEEVELIGTDKKEGLHVLNVDEVDEVSGGLFPALVGAAYIGLVGYALWKHQW